MILLNRSSGAESWVNKMAQLGCKGFFLKHLETNDIFEAFRKIVLSLNYHIEPPRVGFVTEIHGGLEFAEYKNELLRIIKKTKVNLRKVRRNTINCQHFVFKSCTGTNFTKHYTKQ